jgi:hypothetical protein
VKQWRGLTTLVRDAVEHGSRAIERIQKETAARPFAILEAIPPIATPAKVIHALHDASIASTHAAIRLAARVVAGTVAAVLAAGDRAED